MPRLRGEEGRDMTGPVSRSSRQRAYAKGKRIALLAKSALEATGFQVQLCPNQVAWIPNKKAPKRIINGKIVYPLIPVSLNSDFFGLWDGIAVSADMRFFFQVTVVDGVPARRLKIQRSGFPCRPYDCILGYIEGRNRHFKVLRAPDFQWTGECLMVAKEKVEETPVTGERG